MPQEIERRKFFINLESCAEEIKNFIGVIPVSAFAKIAQKVLQEYSNTAYALSWVYYWSRQRGEKLEKITALPENTGEIDEASAIETLCKFLQQGNWTTTSANTLFIKTLLESQGEYQDINLQEAGVTKELKALGELLVKKLEAELLTRERAAQEKAEREAERQKVVEEAKKLKFILPSSMAGASQKKAILLQAEKNDKGDIQLRSGEKPPYEKNYFVLVKNANDQYALRYHFFLNNREVDYTVKSNPDIDNILQAINKTPENQILIEELKVALFQASPPKIETNHAKNTNNVANLLDKQWGATLFIFNNRGDVPQYKKKVGNYLLFKHNEEWVLAIVTTLQGKVYLKNVDVSTWRTFNTLVKNKTDAGKFNDKEKNDLLNIVRSYDRRINGYKSMQILHAYDDIKAQPLPINSYVLTRQNQHWQLYYIDTLNKPIPQAVKPIETVLHRFNNKTPNALTADELMVIEQALPVKPTLGAIKEEAKAKIANAVAAQALKTPQLKAQRFDKDRITQLEVLLKQKPNQPLYDDKGNRGYQRFLAEKTELKKLDPKLLDKVNGSYQDRKQVFDENGHDPKEQQRIAKIKESLPPFFEERAKKTVETKPQPATGDNLDTHTCAISQQNNNTSTQDTEKKEQAVAHLTNFFANRRTKKPECVTRSEQQLSPAKNSQ